MSADISHAQLANAIRALSFDAVQRANSGHPGMPMGMADVATVLFRDFLKFSPDDPQWADRDRLVLSAGHGSMLLYALLYLTGYRQFDIEAIKQFRQLGSPCAGHPEYEHDGVETTTGPLGQGLANAVGMAIAERHLSARWGADLVDHRTYAIVGDGCLMEGISHEAASLAGHLRLQKLTVLFDDNGISIDGSTNLAVSDDTPARFRAYGWEVICCDGHRPDAIADAISRANDSPLPALVCCRTQIGYGSPNKANTAKAHGAPLGEDEVALTRESLDWPHPPFQIPETILNRWREIGQRHDSHRAQWRARLDSHPDAAAFIAQMNHQHAPALADQFESWLQQAEQETKPVATRQSNGAMLEKIVDALPQVFGGSADLSGSNCTHVAQALFTAADGAGRYLHYGVREHAMVAAMNGLYLHGGVIPYGGTFLAFSDYARPALRLAALMGLGIICVMTHDSIGLGEDGPTHQPVEHLAALRAIPNLNVFRPADAVEVVGCWQMALQHHRTPSIFALSRQALPPLARLSPSATETLSSLARGGYILSDAESPRVVLAASGSEVHLCEQAAGRLRDRGIAVRVISVPCLDLLYQQDDDYVASLLPREAALLVVEAASDMPWYRLGTYVRRIDFVCMKSFGQSAPYEQLATHYGFTAENIEQVAAGLIDA